MLETPKVITLKDVCFSYNKREILHNINISIPGTSMTAIVGPNGGGKTTLLHLILGILEPDRGQIELLGSSPKMSRSKVGYVPQKLEIDKDFPVSCSDVVRMGLLTPTKGRARGKAANDSIAQAMDSTGVAHLSKQAFSKISGGEHQRVLIAKALVGNPELLLLDEPTANVDPRSEHELYELFHSLNERISIVFVSHNLNVVSHNVSHVVCVNHTAAVHPIQDVLESTFTELYGGKLAVIHHGDSCHINDPSHALSQPHAACNHPHHEEERS